MRDTTIIYRSFYEAIKELPKENQAEVWDAIFEFSLNFKEVELQGISKTIFTLIKPNLQANIKRYESGNKAKRKRKGSKVEAKHKQNGSEVEANKDKDKDKDNYKNNENTYMFFLKSLNLCTKRNYRGSKKVEASYFARIKEGYVPENFITAINNAINTTYHKENNFEYLTPEFFTRADKLDKFLNASPLKTPATNEQGNEW